MQRHRIKPVALTASLLLSITGCVSPDRKSEVAAVQLDVVTRLAESYALDFAALRSLTERFMQTQHELLRADLESQLLTAYITPAGEADLDALAAELEAPIDAPSPDPLIAEIRAGRLSRSDAETWLSDFAIAWRMSRGVEVRAALLAQFEPMQNLATAHDALRTALNERAELIARAFADAVASSASLVQAHALEREFTSPVHGLLLRVWREHILTSVADPASRDLLTTVLSDFAPDLLATDSEPIQ